MVTPASGFYVWPQYLLKNIRNNLKNHGFAQVESAIKLSFIEAFYEFDKDLSIRMAPKLTENHIYLKPFTSMRVNLAAKVLSLSVAAGKKLEKLEAEAQATAIFIDMLFKGTMSTSASWNSMVARKPFHVKKVGG